MGLVCDPMIYMQTTCLSDLIGEVCVQWDPGMTPFRMYVLARKKRRHFCWFCKQPVKTSLIRLFYYLVLSPFFNDIYYQIEMAIETLQKSDGLSTHRSSLLNSHVSCLFFTYTLSCLFCMLSLPLNVLFYYYFAVLIFPFYLLVTLYYISHGFILSG